ncbi:MAG: SURF1 family protein [Gammaproteobacteria bacterium]|nr:SURF1 family protein [Gammaproteobacteria bacterium]
MRQVSVFMNIVNALNITLFTISLGKLEFKPGLIPTLVTLVFVYLLVSLGMWQLDRAAYKTNIQNIINERKDLPTVRLSLAPTKLEESIYLPVMADGVFDNNHQILLDNRVVNHQAGYDVFTVLIRDNGPALLVNRGWIKQGRTRQNIPDIFVDSQLTRIKGILTKPPSHGLILSENVNQYHQWPATAQFIDLHEIELFIGHQLYPMILMLDKDHTSALHREPIIFKINSTKHLGYAFQWFGLATALVIIYLVVNTKREGSNND